MVACLLLLSAFRAEAETAQPLSEGEQSLINFGFATQLGSGVYSLSGRTLQVYNLPLSWDLPERDDARVQFRLMLPVTIGFLDFRAVDVLDNGLPQHLDTYGFVPGVEADVRINASWIVQPFAQAGFAHDATSAANERVHAAGLRSYVDFGRGVTRWQQYGEVVHVVVEQPSDGGTDDFTRLRVGLTARRPFDDLGTGQREDILGYAFVEVFTDAPAGPATKDSDCGSPPQYEVGFTLGATQGLHLWKLPIPRLGFGYRFGDGLHVYRFVIGSPY
jgi:hypothetical protein